MTLLLIRFKKKELIKTSLIHYNMINSTNTSYNIRAIMSELLPDFLKDLFFTVSPLVLWLAEILPMGLAVVTGTIGAMHLWRKYQLSTLEVKLKQKELDKHTDESN